MTTIERGVISAQDIGDLVSAARRSSVEFSEKLLALLESSEVRYLSVSTMDPVLMALELTLTDECISDEAISKVRRIHEDFQTFSTVTVYHMLHRVKEILEIQ